MHRAWKDHPLWSHPAFSYVFLSFFHLYLIRPESKGGGGIRGTIKASIALANSASKRRIFPGDERELKRLYGRVITFTQRNTYRMNDTAALDAVLVFLTRRTDKESPAYKWIGGQFDFWSAAEAIVQNDESRLEELVEEHLESGGHGPTAALRSVSDHYFGQSDEKFEEAWRYFSPSGNAKNGELEDNEKAYFECYRYSSIAGKVAKSFQVVTRPDSATPYTRFTNYMEGPNGRRVSDGIVLRLTFGLVFVGRINDPGIALKVMSFKIPSQWIEQSIPGVFMCIDRNDVMITGRILLKRSDKTDHRQVRTGLRDLHELAGELSEEDIKSFRNFMEFKLLEDIYYGEGRGTKLTQTGMVEFVEKLLCGEGDVPLLRKGHPDSGKLFNPASHKEYPFNQAVGIYRHGEDDE